MDTFVPDFDSVPDPRSQNYGEDVVAWLAGTYSSGWSRLIAGAWSSAYSALIGTSRAFASWQRMKQRQVPPAELDVVADLNYLASFHGAALGAVVLTAFAIESFVRTGYVVSLELSRDRATRKRGLANEHTRLQKKFDKAPSMERLALLCNAVGIPRDAKIESQVDELIEYRNGLAHDSPQLHTDTGTLQTAFRDRPLPKAPYEALTWSHRPARLKQVIAAIRAHDELVVHSLSTAEANGWADAVRSFGEPWPEIAKALPGKPWWEKLNELSDEWENGPEQREATDAEAIDFRNDFARRTKVKLVTERSSSAT